MALPPAFLDELRARTPMPALVSRRVKLARSGRQWKGCCPFHGEKTPSFYVYEDGFHCFGCGAHGDAISFVMQTQGSSFVEAVTALAGEAGLEVPRPSREAAEQERRRADLHEVLEAACGFYRERLQAPEGAAARAYLGGRGLTEETVRGLGLGWSGEGRGALAAALGRQGIEPARLLEAGLLREGEHGPPRDLFFARVMFPIRDRGGRLVSFGGRILGDGQPKYLNGPETPIFSKRRTLYGLDRAREAVRGGAAVVAVEGYMDVIALSQAGFGAAVAPLGTALTAEQLEALWRLSPAPVLCFDGDAAGRRAGLRAAEVALPLLGPERTLCLVRLPEGEDPDTLVRGRGPAAFQALLKGKSSLVDALFEMRSEGIGPEPEARAGLLARLDADAASIGDRGLASEFRDALRDRYYAKKRRDRAAGGSGVGASGFDAGRFGGPRFGAGRSGASRAGAQGWGGTWGQGQGAGRSGWPDSTAPRTEPRVTPDEATATAERLRILAAIVLRHPELVHDVEEAWGLLALPDGQNRLRQEVRAWAEASGTGHTTPSGADPSPPALDSTALLSHLSDLGLAGDVAQVLADAPLPLPSCSRPDAMPSDAMEGWFYVFGLLHGHQLDDDVAEAQRACVAKLDAANQNRLIALCRARDHVRRGEQGPDVQA